MIGKNFLISNIDDVCIQIDLDDKEKKRIDASFHPVDIYQIRFLINSIQIDNQMFDQHEIFSCFLSKQN